MAQIFISHSAHDDLTRAVRLRLIERLSEMGLKPLVDKDIQPGEPWREKLHYWLGCCDGAVLLFSRPALGSPWVRKEATILTWRKSLDTRFRLVPVPLGDVSPQELTQGYLSSLEVGEIEWAQIDVTGKEVDTLDQLVEQIVRCFKGLAPGGGDPVLRSWIERATSCLRKADPATLERTAALLGITEQDWRGLCEPAAAIAHHLLHTAGLDCVLRALAEVMADLPLESRETLRGMVEPLWVREEAARHILPVTRRAETDRLLAINAQLQDTGHYYIHRATCGSTGSLILRTSGVFGEDQAAEILAAFDKGCRRIVFGPGEGREVPSLLRERILQKSLRRQPGPVFLLVTELAVRRDVVEALRGRFPMATLVLLTGSSFPDREALGLPQLELIKPPLEEAEEEEAFATIFVLKRLAENRPSGDPVHD